MAKRPHLDAFPLCPDDVADATISSVLTKVDISPIYSLAQVTNEKSSAPVAQSNSAPLYDKLSPEGKIFHQERERITTDSKATAMVSNAEAPPATTRTRRRSRWDTPAPAVAPIAITGATENYGISQQDQAHMLQRRKEQQELQLLESRIREAAMASLNGQTSSEVHTTRLQEQDGLSNAVDLPQEQADLYLERLRQYKELMEKDDGKKDSVEEAEQQGGVIEGGTWEHRKRAKEMLDSAAKSLEVTLRSSGKHHMSDYLPREVLQNFLQQANALAKGTSSSSTNGPQIDTEKRLDESSLGHQLLKKAGWEGSGLGAQSQGMVAPLSASTAASAQVNAGIGTKNTFDLEAGDDNFTAYRKRMMLAYRYRPNPLNNPRRNYY